MSTRVDGDQGEGQRFGGGFPRQHRPHRDVRPARPREGQASMKAAERAMMLVETSAPSTDASRLNSDWNQALMTLSHERRVLRERHASRCGEVNWAAASIHTREYQEGRLGPCAHRLGHEARGFKPPCGLASSFEGQTLSTSSAKPVASSTASRRSSQKRHRDDRGPKAVRISSTHSRTYASVSSSMLRAFQRCIRDPWRCSSRPRPSTARHPWRFDPLAAEARPACHRCPAWPQHALVGRRIPRPQGGRLGQVVNRGPAGT